MKFTKENVIKVFGEYMEFEDEEMLKYDDFVIEIMNMDDDEEETEVKKDIEWAKKEIKELMTEESQNYPHDEMIEKEIVLSILDQLDEPTKPVIPKFVAEWLEEAKCSKTLFGAMNQSPKKVDYWFIKSDDNQDLFARAWLDGYNVEKEQRYILSINITDKASKTNYKTYLNKRGIFHSMENKSFNNEEFNWTEEEIKCLENGEILFEHFATKVEEMEE